MPRVTSVKRSRKTFTAGDGVKIEKGCSYFHWKFNFGPKCTSSTYPDKRQLTRSGYLISMYDIEDKITAIVTDESIEDQIQEVVDELEILRDEQQDSLDNMPEHLQESSASGELLQERIDSLENTISEFENIDTYTDEGLKEEAKQARYEEISEEAQNISLEY